VVSSKAFSGSALQAIFIGSFKRLFWVVVSGHLLLVLWHSRATGALPAGRL